jgi:type II secretory ATPase GspE/PulE/Tfp pilus assembly ATPase PilB-like protein
LRVINQLPAEASPQLTKYFKKIAGLDVREKNFSQISTIFHGKARIRVSISPVFGGEKITLRMIRARTSLRKLNEIGLWGENLRLVRQAIRQPRGIIFTVGDGKNTTNFAILNELNTPEKNIVTIESRIEKLLPGVNQIEIKPKIGFTALEATQAALNQNPDIIYIDELVDPRVIQLAIDAAMRGKLIIASLPIANASDVLPFLQSLGVSPFLLSANTAVIIGQTLVRTTAPSALDQIKLSGTESSAILNNFEIKADEIHKLEKLAEKEIMPKNKISTNHEQITTLNILKSTQAQTGFIGSTGIFEVVSLIDGNQSDKIKNFVLSAPNGSQIRDFAYKNGVIPLKIDG